MNLPFPVGQGLLSADGHEFLREEMGTLCSLSISLWHTIEYPVKYSDDLLGIWIIWFVAFYSMK